MFKPISRRTMLRGMGVAMALPWMESMTGSLYAGEKLTKPPVRTAFLFKPNGVRPDYWTPKGRGEKYTADTPYLKPLQPHQSEFILLENLWNKQTSGRNGHWPKVPAWLSGGFVVRTTGRDMDVGGTTVDQIMARILGARTPLPSIELGIDEPRIGVDNVGGGFTRIYGNHISWKDSHTPMMNEIVPRRAFDRLFRSGLAPALRGLNPDHPAVKKSMVYDDSSVLDLVREQSNTLQRKISVNDREKLDEYFESVRSVEKRITASMKPMARWENKKSLEVPRPSEGVPRDHETHVRLMLDILVLAFWTDTTRIATFMFGNAQSGKNYSFLPGVNGSYHGLSHHRNEEKVRKQYETIGIWHSKQMAYLLEKMKNLDEGGSSLLDNSMLLYGSTLKCGNRHDNHDLPLILCGKAGGAIKTGRRLTSKKDTPLCDLYVSMLHRMGIMHKKFGDSKGIIDLG